jgi:hypothetical protein
MSANINPRPVRQEALDRHNNLNSQQLPSDLPIKSCKSPEAREQEYQTPGYMGDDPEQWFRCSIREHFCYVKDHVLVLIAETNEWSPYKRSDAGKMLWQEYGDLASAYVEYLLEKGELDVEGQKTPKEVATSMMMKQFGESILLRSGLVWFPGHGTYCTFDGTPRLNTFVDNRVGLDGEITDDDFSNDALSGVVGLFAQLGGYDPIDGADVVFDGESSAAWIAQWVAHAWQKPEQRINTMLWLVSKSFGVGKGTLFDLLAEVFGEKMVKKITQGEIESDKNGSMSETLFLNFDEANAFNKVQVTNTFKSVLGSKTLNIRKLYMDAVKTPNVLRLLGTTNELSPIALQEGDRRHTLIRCREGISAKQWAKDFYSRMENDENFKDECLCAFIYLLQNMEVDFDFINTPLKTELRDRMLDMGIPTIERWFVGISPHWEPDEFRTNKIMWEDFSDYCNRVNEKSISKKWFDNHVLNHLENWISRPDNDSERHKGQRGYFKVNDHPDAPYIAQSERIISIKSAQAAKKLERQMQDSNEDCVEGTNNE